MNRRSLWRTTAFRLTTMFGAVFALGVILLLGLVYVETAAYLDARVDRQLRAEAEVFARAGPEATLGLLRRQAALNPLDHFALYSADATRLAGDSRLRPADLPADGSPREITRRDEGPRRAMAARLPWGERLIVSRDAGQLREIRRILLGALALGGGVIGVAGLGAGIALSLRPIARVQAVREAADAITAGDLAARLPVRRRPGDELDELASIVNGALDEVERLVVQARSVGESVAHELRTPLTRLRATLEHAADEAPPHDPRRALIDRCVAETDGVLARFSALLRISAVEARGRIRDAEEIDLCAVLEQAVELYAPLAVERGVVLTFTPSPPRRVRADAALLFEAVSNLIDNALKFTPRGGHVRVAALADGPAIEVVDDGPGIPEAERALVAGRFYRGRGAAAAPGFGLGLSLVKAVADLHGFRFEIADAPTGTTARLVCGPALSG